MPKFVYVKTLYGVGMQILHDDSVFGVTGEKDIGILQSHDITEAEVKKGFTYLYTTYKYKVRVKAGRG